MATTKKKSSSHHRKYGPKAQKKVARAMRKYKHGTLRRSKKGHGGKVTSRKQAIAIGLSEARKEGDKVPSRKSSSRSKRSRSSSSHSRSHSRSKRSHSKS